MTATTARFVVKEKRKVRLDRRAAWLAVGSGPAVDLFLGDPIAAALHCRLVVRGTGLIVEDRDNDTGTYRNGLRVAGAAELQDGDELVVGTTRLGIGIADADGDLTVTVQLTPQSVGFVPSSSGEFASDPDRWVHTEVELGRFPALRRSNRMALRALIVGTPLLLLVGSLREPLVDPGPLSAVHAALFTSDGFDPRFADQAALAAADGCAVCHDAFFGTPDDRCARCHAETARNHHPFGGAEIAAGAPIPGYTCARCHGEHHGGDGMVPAPETTPDACAGCHGGSAIEARGYTTERAAAAVPMAERSYLPVRFAHRDHAAAACSLCHDRAAVFSPSVGNFAPVAYETCARCHDRDAVDPDPSAIPAAWRPRAEHRWEVRWHGTDDDGENCARCHDRGTGAGGHGPDYKSVPRREETADAYAASRARYRLQPRSHDEFLTAADRDCGRCHRRQNRLAPAAPPPRTFWHELHLDFALGGALDGTSPALQRARSDTCRACHADLDEAQGLVDQSTAAYGCADEARCGTCHREGRDRPLVPLAEAAPPAATAAAIDFPHAAHLDFDPGGPLAAGCFACHAFAATSDSGPFAVPTTSAEAARCMPCHQAHDNVGGDGCRQCHPSPAEEYEVYLGPTPPADRPLPTRAWPLGSTFDHDSPGHRQPTEGDCRTCHRDDSAVDSSQGLGDLRVPNEAAPVCRECHLGDRTRFHWR